MCKTHQHWATFGSWDVEKVHAVVARSTFPSQECNQTDRFRALLEVEMFKKCTPLWREAHFDVKSAKNWGVRNTFGRSDIVSRGRRKGLCTVSKVSKTWGFCSISKNDGEEDLQRCIFRGRRSTRDMFIRAVRRSGRWFPDRGCILEHQIFWFSEMLSRDRCSISYDLASLFRGRRSTLDRWSGKTAKRKTHWYEAVSSALNFLFLKEVSQHCFVFDVVNFENCGSLSGLSHFLCCQVQKVRKSRRIVSFLMLSSSKNKEASSSLQADKQIDR